MAPSQDSAGSGSFATTPWSLLLAARQTSHPSKSEKALSHLCEIYWRPIYNFIRAHSCDSDEAGDLTQRFMAHLIERDRFVQADPTRGRFRSYVLGILKLFLANVRRDERAQRRGGDAVIVPLDATIIEEGERDVSRCGGFHLAHPADRPWAVAIQSRLLACLAKEYAATGKSNLYSVLLPYLSDEQERGSHEKAAALLGRPVATIRSDVARLRRRYGELLLDELRAQAPDANIAEEVVYFCRLIVV